MTEPIYTNQQSVEVNQDKFLEHLLHPKGGEWSIMNDTHFEAIARLGLSAKSQLLLLLIYRNTFAARNLDHVKKQSRASQAQYGPYWFANEFSEKQLRTVLNCSTKTIERSLKDLRDRNIIRIQDEHIRRNLETKTKERAWTIIFETDCRLWK